MNSFERLQLVHKPFLSQVLQLSPHLKEHPSAVPLQVAHKLVSHSKIKVYNNNYNNNKENIKFHIIYT